MRTKQAMAIESTNGSDEDVRVAELAERRAALASELAATEATERALRERMNPPTREEAVATTSKTWSWLGAGAGFGWRDYEHVDRRVVAPEVDAEDVELARLELAPVRLAAIRLRRKLAEAERDLKAARCAAWARDVPAADQVERAALREIATLLMRAAELMRVYADETAPALNAKIGRDPGVAEHAAPRYHVPSRVFAPLYAADERSGSLLDLWLATLTREGVL